MTLEQFRATLADANPPDVAQETDDVSGSWVHAYLHRKEGDLGNAAYWYRRAGRPSTDISLATEWRDITETLLRTR